MDEYFSAWFPLPSCVLPGLAHRANNFVRGVYIGFPVHVARVFHRVKADFSIFLLSRFLVLFPVSIL